MLSGLKCWSCRCWTLRHDSPAHGPVDALGEFRPLQVLLDVLAAALNSGVLTVCVALLLPLLMVLTDGLLGSVCS